MRLERELHKAAAKLGLRRVIDVTEIQETRLGNLKKKREGMRKKIKPSLYQP